MVIDSHVHVLPEYRLKGLAKWMKKAFPGHEISDNPVPEALVRDLKKGGITHFFNLVYPVREEETEALNSFNIEFCRKTPGAIPFGSVHQDTRDKAGLAEKLVKENSVAGFKLHPFVQGFDPWDSRMDSFYAFMEEAVKPVIFHTGFDDFYRRSMPVDELKRLMDRYPAMPTVFVHMAFPCIEEVFGMMDHYPNLYLDATGVFVYFREGFNDYLPDYLKGERFGDILQKGLEKYRGRVLFGSDHPVGWGAVDKVYNDISFIDISEEAEESLKYMAAVDFIDRFMPGFDWGPNLQKNI